MEGCEQSQLEVEGDYVEQFYVKSSVVAHFGVAHERAQTRVQVHRAERYGNLERMRILASLDAQEILPREHWRLALVSAFIPRSKIQAPSIGCQSQAVSR